MLRKKTNCTKITLNKKELLYFGGTSYYCLHSNKELMEAAIKSIEENGLGIAVSRSTYGKSELLQTLEKKTAEFFNREDAILLPSGYLSTLAALKALHEINNYEFIYIDENSHFSVKDGAKASGIKIVGFKHLDYFDLSNKIIKSNKKSIIVSDGVFPLFGTVAPLDRYSELAEKYNFDIWIDDSHGAGVLGKNQRGSLEHWNLETKNYIYTGATLSKAFGSYGGIIYGNLEFINMVKNGHVANGSNTMPNSVISSALKGLEMIKKHPEWAKSLSKNAIYLKSKLRDLGIDIPHNEFPVISWSCGGNEDKVNFIYNYLLEKNIAIQKLKYSGYNKTVLRIVVFSQHTKTQIETLANEINNAINLTKLQNQ